MHVACSTHLKDYKCLQTSVQKRRIMGRQENDIKLHNVELGFKDLEIFIRLKIGPVVDFCEHDNELLDSTIAGELIS
jgi:hypothetical protein